VKDYKLKRAVITVDMVKDINGRKEFPLAENKIGYVRLTSVRREDQQRIGCRAKES
jgi:hypothetical protein